MCDQLLNHALNFSYLLTYTNLLCLCFLTYLLTSGEWVEGVWEETNLRVESDVVIL